MKTVLIVYHSMTGGARQMAEAAQRGASAEPEVQAKLVHARDATGGDVLQADGYIFATPENLASMSGVMKDFFDRTYYAAFERIEGRPYATLICAGSDGANAVRQIDRICLGWRLKPVSEPLIVCTHAQTPEAILVRHFPHRSVRPAGCELRPGRMAAVEMQKGKPTVSLFNVLAARAADAAPGAARCSAQAGCRARLASSGLV